MDRLWAETRRHGVPVGGKFSCIPARCGSKGNAMARPKDLIPHLSRLLRYVAIGGMVSVFYTALVLVLITMVRISPPLASMAGFFVVLPVSFIGHQRVSFRDSAPHRRQPQRFVVIALSSFALSVGGMYLCANVLRIGPIAGILFAWVMVPAANFLINSFWVFPIPRRIAGDGSHISPTPSEQ